MAYREKSMQLAETNKRYYPPKKNRLSEYQLQVLDEEIERYSFDKNVSIPKKETIRVFDEWKWLKSKGAVTANHDIIIKHFIPATYDSEGRLKTPCDCEPILYEQLQKDLEQWRMWKGRKEFIENKKIEGLEEIARGMRINP